jgi:aryl-alcohol dehydrogenase-like predicted oxidoreductase
MKYQLLGRSGLRVSELALGTMTFGEAWGWGASKEESQAVFNAYLEAGGNFIDTANNYTDGASEQLVGAFATDRRDELVIATKYTLSLNKADPNAGGNHRKSLRGSVESSLQRLRTDYIDLLWLHMWDSTTPIDEVMRALDDLVRAGKVLHVGVSDTPAWIVSQANTIAGFHGWSPFVALQIPYSLARRDAERDLLPMARAFGMTVTPWGILAGGVLSGKYSAGGDEPRRYSDDDVKPERVKLAEALSKIATELGRTPSQVAIAWVRGRPGIGMIPILGARTVEQLGENLASLEVELDDDQRQRLDDLSGFKPGFPTDFLTATGVLDLIHGELEPQIERPVSDVVA